MLETLFITSSGFGELPAMEHPEAIFVLPFIDREMALRLEGVLRHRALAPGLVVFVEDDLRMGFMKVSNIVYGCSSSRYFGYLAQDAFPGDGWLRSALQALDSGKAGLLAFNDGRFFGTLAVFGLARRTWVDTLYGGKLFHPGYHSHFGDTELSAIAMQHQQLVFNAGSLMVEVDYEKHEKRNDPRDAALFKKRAASGFDGLTQPLQV